MGKTIQGTILLIWLSKDMREREQARDNDYEIVSSCKKGDVDAFEELVRRHQKRMLNIAYRMIGNYDVACEIVQDAFVSAYKNIADFQGRARFSTWLYTIVVNLSKNRLKKLKIQRFREPYSIDDPIPTEDGSIPAEPASNEPSALERLEKRDIQQQVQGCINALHPEFREVLILRDIQGFSYDEIGALLRVAEGTVKSRLFRAREALRDCLKRTMGDL